MAEQQYILKVEGLSVDYGSFHAVKNVGFEVLPGEIFGLLGPNGAGKTSTLSSIEGLIKFKTGTIIVDGQSVAEKPLHAKASMGVQLQSTSFQPELNVVEILRLFAGIYGVSLSKDNIDTILKEIGLEDHAAKKFSQLSGGQQQRVSLVISTIHNPRLVLLDEPTNHPQHGRSRSRLRSNRYYRSWAGYRHRYATGIDR
jgi:ABC-2 type transport system ATP-binding protein